jgi:hypothetical protein
MRFICWPLSKKVSAAEIAAELASFWLNLPAFCFFRSLTSSGKPSSIEQVAAAAAAAQAPKSCEQCFTSILSQDQITAFLLVNSFSYIVLIVMSGSYHIKLQHSSFFPLQELK